MLKHPDSATNIVRLCGSWKQNDICSILLEFLNGDTMADLFSSSHPTNSRDRLTFWKSLLQILEPLGRIHQHTDPEDFRRIISGYVYP